MRQEWSWLKMNKGHRQELPAYLRNHSGAQINPARILPRVNRENHFHPARALMLRLPPQDPPWVICQWFRGNNPCRPGHHILGAKFRATLRRVIDRWNNVWRGLKRCSKC